MEVSRSAFSEIYDYLPLASTADDLLQDITLPTGAATQMSYDGLGQLLGTEIDVGFSVFDQHGYAYNQGFQRTQQVFQAGNYVNYA